MIDKRVVIASYSYKNLKEAEEQINKWQEEDSLNEDAKVYEITGIIYKPIIKLVKQNEKQSKKD